MASDGTLTQKKRRLVAALLTSPSVRAAAQAADVSERTAWRWLSDDAVKAELRKRQDAILTELAAGLVADASEARGVLRSVMLDKASPRGVRVRAATVLLDAALRFAELVSMTDRLERLEAAVKGLQG